MTEKKKTCFERVANAMHGVDDSVRDVIVYPDRSTVLGISEGVEGLVLSYATNHDDGDTQMIWINPDEPNVLLALQESVARVLARVNEKGAQKRKRADEF